MFLPARRDLSGWAHCGARSSSSSPHRQCVGAGIVLLGLLLLSFLSASRSRQGATCAKANPVNSQCCVPANPQEDEYDGDTDKSALTQGRIWETTLGSFERNCDTAQRSLACFSCSPRISASVVWLPVICGGGSGCGLQQPRRKSLASRVMRTALAIP